MIAAVTRWLIALTLAGLAMSLVLVHAATAGDMAGRRPGPDGRALAGPRGAA